MFKGKRVLVTGADGFIGSHLSEALVNGGANVRSLSLYNSFNDWGWLEDSKKLKEMEIVTGDIRDPHLCMKIVKDVDVVFHLAALIAIPYSYIAPSSYVDTNITGTLNMCQAALHHNIQKFIHTSTSEVYGTALYVPIDEKHPLQPQSPYSASKIGADCIAQSFANSFKLPMVVARPFNTYGPRQSARAVIPTIISQLAKNIKKISLGDIRPTRDFNYVADTCNGFLAVAQSKLINGEVVNIGSNQEVSIEETFNLIKKIMKSDAQIILDEQRIRPESSEVHRLWCDNSKLKNETGYVHKYSLEAGLKETIDWFLDEKNLKHYKAEIYNV